MGFIIKMKYKCPQCKEDMPEIELVDQEEVCWGCRKRVRRDME